MKSADDIPKRLKPACGSLFFLIVCAVFSMALWNEGATYETWDKETAKVVARRLEERKVGVWPDERYEYMRVRSEILIQWNRISKNVCESKQTVD